MQIFPAYGGAPFREETKKVIRLILKGCVNRPFFHISVQEKNKEPEDPVIEQIGSYDSLPNQYNEKLVAVNFQRLEYWIKKGALLTDPVLKLLGLCGYFPVHPLSFKEAFKNRQRLANVLEELKIKAAEICPNEVNKSDKSDEELSKTVSQDKLQCTTSAEEHSLTPSSEAHSSIPSVQEPVPNDDLVNKKDPKN